MCVCVCERELERDRERERECLKNILIRAKNVQSDIGDESRTCH